MHYADQVDSGNFAFTAHEEGDYLACLWAPDHKPPVTMAVEFEWRTGVAAKDWTNVAKKGQIEVSEVFLNLLISLSYPTSVYTVTRCLFLGVLFISVPKRNSLIMLNNHCCPHRGPPQCASVLILHASIYFKRLSYWEMSQFIYFYCLAPPSVSRYWFWIVKKNELVGGNSLSLFNDAMFIFNCGMIS